MCMIVSYMCLLYSCGMSSCLCVCVCVCVCVRLYLRMYVGIYIMCIMRAFVNTIRSSTLSQVVTQQDNL